MTESWGEFPGAAVMLPVGRAFDVIEVAESAGTSRVTARRYLDQGFLYLTVANELGLITIGGRAELAIARGTVTAAGAAVI